MSAGILGGKRGFSDAMMMTDSLSPPHHRALGKIALDRYVFASASKRPRTAANGMAVDSPARYQPPHQSLSNRKTFADTDALSSSSSSSSCLPEDTDSGASDGAGGGSALSHTATPEENAQLLALVPLKKRALLLNGLAGETDPVLSFRDLRSIIRKAVRETESNAEQRMQALLEERLADQWQVFSKYHEDHVNRQLRDRELSYLS